MSFFAAIDLKSFYASVECVERGLNPLTTNLVVADQSRTDKTICLAVSPSLKSHGISGRARLFEVVQKVGEVNALRKGQVPKRFFTGKSWDDIELRNNPELELDYIVATPRMALYMEYSARIYEIYLKYIAPKDLHIYSVDEVFIDVTPYMKTYRKSPREIAMMIIKDVLRTTGITATAGIGTNLYLSKVAMDIIAKHVPADKDGVRIAELDERSYREQLWNHRPLTDFWRVGRGYAKKLESVGIYTMGDIARCSIGRSCDFYNEDLLYEMFGVNTELLIDHSWGWEPCTMADIKAYRPSSNSISTGQVLQSPYPFEKARLVLHEMADNLSMELVSKGLVTNQIVLDVGFDIENIGNGNHGAGITADRYGRKVPKPVHGSINLPQYGSSTIQIVNATLSLFDQIVNKELLIRRLTLTAAQVISKEKSHPTDNYEQINLFTSMEEQDRKRQEEKQLEKERKIQDTILNIRKRYGKNSLLKGYNFEDGATAIERNRQIGGHKA